MLCYVDRSAQLPSVVVSQQVPTHCGLSGPPTYTKRTCFVWTSISANNLSTLAAIASLQHHLTVSSFFPEAVLAVLLYYCWTVSHPFCNCYTVPHRLERRWASALQPLAWMYIRRDTAYREKDSVLYHDHVLVSPAQLI